MSINIKESKIFWKELPKGFAPAQSIIKVIRRPREIATKKAKRAIS